MKNEEIGFPGEKEISRRSFLQGAAAISAAGVVGFVASPTQEAQAAETPPWLPTEWADEADVIVVGIGGAGLGAAIEGIDKGLGDILVLEAAPEHEAGGNSRVCGQLLCIPRSPEAAVTYQSALNGYYTVEPELLKAWADEICKNKEWLEGMDISIQETAMASPEHPDKPGSDQIQDYLPGGQLGFEVVWQQLLENALQKGAKIEYGVRVMKLIQNPLTKEILGVTSENGDNYKARKGVILACGGFENNQKMLNDYFRGTASTVLFIGTPYNRGDGIHMAQSVGADLWHMNNYAGMGLSLRGKSPDNSLATYIGFRKHDYIFVGPNGNRFVYEEHCWLTRHGYISLAGGNDINSIPFNTWVVFGKESIEGGLNTNTFPPCGWLSLIETPPSSDPKDFITNGIIVSADTPRELASKIGVDPDGLEKTLATYAEFVANNQDLDYGKGRPLYNPGEEEPAVPAFDLVPIEPPYYAAELCHTLLNTQGGPRRGVNGEVIDTEGKPIPRLYAAGELGPVYSFLYNGGGNFSEALSSGRIAVRHAGAQTDWVV